MEEFADISRARNSYKAFVEAVSAGREIMRKAGVPDPPPIPDFDTIFRRLTPPLRTELYAALRENPATAPGEAIRIWQPLIRKAFAPLTRN